MTTSQQKGDALETVVAAIETTILRASPSAEGKNNRIESKKIVTVGGVRHEIDIYVTSEIAPGYKAVFIFECKNWKDAVGKNEIIVLSEKIDACSAQHGFFVAKSFTSDAEAQAKKDPRVTLLIATEHNPVSTIVPFGFHLTFPEVKHIDVHFDKRGSEGPKKPARIELSTVEVRVDGVAVPTMTYLNDWSQEAVNESMLTFPSGTLADGAYNRTCESRRQFAPNRLTVDGNDMETANLRVEFIVHLKRPAVASHFEVGGRGRVISLEGYSQGPISFDKLEFVFGPGVPPDGS